MNVNFNKMLEALFFKMLKTFFNGLMHSIYIKYTSHKYKQVMKSGGSSSEHYF